MGKPAALYCVKHIACPDLYIAEKANGWDKKDAAMKETKAWWLSNLSPDWNKIFVMEKVK